MPNFIPIKFENEYMNITFYMDLKTMFIYKMTKEEIENRQIPSPIGKKIGNKYVFLRDLEELTLLT